MGEAERITPRFSYLWALTLVPTPLGPILLFFSAAYMSFGWWHGKSMYDQLDRVKKSLILSFSVRSLLKHIKHMAQAKPSGGKLVRMGRQYIPVCEKNERSISKSYRRVKRFFSINLLLVPKEPPSLPKCTFSPKSTYRLTGVSKTSPRSQSTG